MKTTYITQDKEAGNHIDTFDTFAVAEKAIKEYEEVDEKEGNFSENFYEIKEVFYDHSEIELTDSVIKICHSSAHGSHLVFNTSYSCNINGLFLTVQNCHNYKYNDYSLPDDSSFIVYECEGDEECYHAFIFDNFEEYKEDQEEEVTMSESYFNALKEFVNGVISLCEDDTRERKEDFLMVNGYDDEDHLIDAVATLTEEERYYCQDDLQKMIDKVSK